MDTELRGAVILSSHNGYRPFVGSVGIENGRIAVVAEKPLGTQPQKVIDARGKILMPGLINGHCHGDMTIAKGMGDAMTLLEQNEAFAGTNWFYSLLTDCDRYDARQLTYCEALLSGTTFQTENMFWSLGTDSAKCMAETGIRGALAEDIRRDFGNPDELLTDDALNAFIQACRAHGLVPVIGSVSEEDFEAALLTRIHAAVERVGVAQTMHLAETQWRLDIIKKKFGIGPVQYLAEHNVLTADLIASHVVHPTEDEIQMLARANVKVVNTPVSEMKIADGVAPVPAMLAAGITVGLGTDGAMWNNTCDLFREMKTMALLHGLTSGVRALSAAQILDMATINGAKVFNMDQELGTIEAGKLADIILIDATAPHMTPLRLGKHENVASAVVFGATGRDVTDVFVGGRHVVRNRQMTDFDTRALCERVTRRSCEIFNAL